MKDFVKYQKVIRVGNSLAVTLDNAFVAEKELHAGDEIVASYSPTHVAFAASEPTTQPEPATPHAPASVAYQMKNAKQNLVLRDASTARYQAKKLSPTEQKAIMHSKISTEFRDWVDKSIAEDKAILEELAHL